MANGNNFSVLPWYSSIEEQNARKWWIYGRIYPLFTQAGYLLPFQIIREHRAEYKIGDALSGEYINGHINAAGVIVDGPSSEGVQVGELAEGTTYVHFEDVPSPSTGGIMAVAKDAAGKVAGTFNPSFAGRVYTGDWQLPAGTAEVYVQTYNTAAYQEAGTIYGARYIPTPLEQLDIYTKDGALSVELGLDDLKDTIAIAMFPERGYDVIVYNGGKLFASMDNGQYYALASDGEDAWYSDVFTVVNDIAPYVKIEWWDIEDFVMDAGTIVYKSVPFRNVLYLCTDIAKPEYDFEEQVVQRGGYAFPLEQISKKRYRFAFFASEYLLDVMRFVRMADYVTITAQGHKYSADTFLLSPEWEDNGDVAAVDAEFTADTVAKKIGLAYLKGLKNSKKHD